MMESNFYSDDFERLIREKTEQYKMYPSEKVWKGVYSSLHTKKRWFIGGMSVLVTGIIVVAGRELILPAAHQAPVKKQALIANLNNPKTTSENTALPAPFTEFRGGGHSAFAHNHNLGPLKDLSSATEESGEIAANDQVIVTDVPAGQTNDPAASLIGQSLDITGVSTVVAKAPSARTESSLVAAAGSGSAAPRTASHEASSNTADARSDSYANYLARIRTGNGLAFGADPYEAQVIVTTTSFPPGNNFWGPGVQIPLHPGTTNRSMARLHAAELLQTVNTDPDDEDNDLLTSFDTTTNTTKQKINWLQDYAVYSMHPSPRKNKGYWQIYLSPTESIRSLSGGDPVNPKSNMTGAQPVPAKPKMSTDLLRDMGFEVGGAVLYKLNRNLSVKAGLQFNYSRFTFASSANSIAPAPAPSGNAGNPLDSARGLAAAGGNQAPQQLTNEYFQLSAPIGLEFRVWGNDRLQVNIAATIQPAYLLNTSAYLLTTENNNYVKTPAFFRKWNIDGGAEAYISYKIGGLRLQAGPEFRYQFLSSYSRQYPLRENLASYGLKIGIIKAIR